MYIYIRICICIFTYVYVYVHMYMYMYTCMYTFRCVFVDLCRKYLHIYIYLCMYHSSMFVGGENYSCLRTTLVCTPYCCLSSCDVSPDAILNKYMSMIYLFTCIWTYHYLFTEYVTYIYIW